MDQIEIASERGATGSTVIFRLKGPLTLRTLFSLQDVLREAGNADTVIDLTEVPYVDSAGLGTILAHWQHSQRFNHKFALSGVSPRVLVIFEMTRVNEMLPMFATAEEADRSFTGAQSPA